VTIEVVSTDVLTKIDRVKKTEEGWKIEEKSQTEGERDDS
jgi:hypothetical protein